MGNGYIDKELAEVVERGAYNALKGTQVKLLEILVELVAKNQSNNRIEFALRRFGATDLLINTCMSAVSYLRSHSSDTR